MKKLTVLLAVWSAVGCGEVARDSAEIRAGNGTVTGEIRNGDVANAREFQGIGAIHATTTQVLCSGSLISRSMVLTAAQCLRDTSPSAVYQFSIGPSETLARQMRGNAPNRVAVGTKIVRHALFDTLDGINLAFDIALIRLEKGESRQWSDVPRYTIAGVDMPTMVHATGVGFGESGLRPVGTRTSGDFLITQYIAGEGPIGNFIPRAFLEVQPGNAKDQMICPGDSGGPVLYNGELAGVASFRFVATCPERGAGYVVTSPRFSGWITDAVNELDPPGACAAEDDAAFVTAGGGCKDLATGNTWSAPGPALVSQPAAADYCKTLREGGRDGWHLATLSELRKLDADMTPVAAGHGDDDEDDDNEEGNDGRSSAGDEHGEDDDDAEHHEVHVTVARPVYVDISGEAWSSTLVHDRSAATFDFRHHRADHKRLKAMARPLCVRNALPI